MKRLFSQLALIFSLSLILAACSGGGGGGGGTSGGGGGGTTSATTTVSGKVTLSSTVSSKPKPRFGKTLAAVNLAPAVLNGATIELYDAEKPEWIYPVATVLSNSSGGYTLSALTNAANNPNTDGSAPYKDGDPIPTGNYTVIAYKYDISFGKLFVAVQAIVKKFAGDVPGNDLVAQDSDGIPSVVSMFGLPQNTDGTYGNSSMTLPSNTAIQVTFSMAMARAGVVDAVDIKDVSGAEVSGKWKVSPDLLTVTFYPFTKLTPGTIYNVTISGGKALKAAKNVYGKSIAAEVTGTFKSAGEDKTPPTAVRNRPTTAEKSSMPLTTPIRIEADEAMDINTMVVTSSPSIGDKPAIQFIGKVDQANPYIYEILPSVSLLYDTTYSITVSGGKDLAGLPMDVLNFSFTTEPKPANVTGTAAEVDAKTAVVNMIGKWINAMNSRNVTLLTSYMTGDFFWLNDPANGMKSEDTNRDGRLSLNEFTAMLTKWFAQLEQCNATVTGGIYDTGAPSHGIVLSNNDKTAVITFDLTAATANTTNPSCKDAGGPSSHLYAELQSINGAWIMVRGSDFAPPSGVYPNALKGIELTSPANGVQYPEPTVSAPLLPEFKWTVPTLNATDPAITSYLVVVIDNKSQWQQTGWAALVDPGAALAGTTLSTKFNPKAGDYGNVMVLDFSGGNNPLGIQTMISDIKPGGSYSFAVLGFKTKTIADFRNLNFDPVAFLFASSDVNNFSVAGIYPELKVTIKDSATGTEYTYDQFTGSYNVGSAGTIDVIVTTPTTSAPNAGYNLSGYAPKGGPLTFTNGVATISSLGLAQGRNTLSICDNQQQNSYQCGGLGKQFDIFTTGGTAPKINNISVTGKTCAAATASLVGPDNWNQYTSTDVCTVNITGTVTSITGQLSLYVNNDSQNGQYSANVTISSGSFAFNNVPVYKGRNWLSIQDQGTPPNYMPQNANSFGIETAAGATFVAPIAATVKILGTTLPPTNSNIFNAQYDAGSAAAITLDVVLQNTPSPSCTAGPCAGWDQWSDPDGTYVTSGNLTSTTTLNIPITLKTGWNEISIGDGMNNWYNIRIFTKGGIPNIPPNIITSVDGNAVTQHMGYFNYTTASCQVTIIGTTTNPGPVNVNLNNYNNATGNSVNEFQTVTPVGGTYTIIQNVYQGVNDININDSQYFWQGVSVTNTATGASCVATVFDVTSIKAGATILTPDVNGDFNAGTASSVVISGTVKANSTVNINVSGLYYNMYPATVTGTTFTATVPIYNGYNSISVTDGFNWIYKNVYTSGGATYTPPIYNVSVSPGTLTSGGAASDTWADWDTTAASVTITGSAKQSGSGSYSLNGTYAPMPITGAATPVFSVTVSLMYGSNNITLYDANMNMYSLYIYSSGGTGAPVQFVMITSPLQNATVGTVGTTSPVTVSGTIDLTKGFMPQYVYGYAYDYTTSVGTSYSSDTYEQTTYGYLPVIYNSLTGAFSFVVPITGGNMKQIYVSAYDASSVNHYYGIYVNNTLGYYSYFGKPGAKLSAKQMKAQAHKTEFLRHIRKGR